ncbi:MAG TPA: L-2-hydroxyglutarate oxidase [Tepidisphaeraceae bacterium]|nr:L-2-hydroxyglutarate oxidase [Tepidisphaeraceae bacterium]
MTALAQHSPIAPVTDGPQRFDVAVIGGGIVGLATAMALASDYSASVVVLEAEGKLAEHQTGNNSGVIHSGLYYKPGSLKARLCTEGRKALVRFCEQRNIPYELCGKVVVATHESELPALDELERRGSANGLADLRRLSIQEIGEYEPHVAGVAGLRVKETGIVNYRRVAEEYAKVIQEFGGSVKTQSRVYAVTQKPDALTLHTTRGDIEAGSLVNCGGLHCDRVARMCGLNPGVKIVPFRGEYYKLSEDAWHLCRSLIYPVPNPAFPFLGVHFTRMIDGGVEAGPNAVLALARHGYSWRNINLKDLAETLAFGGFWKMSMKYWKAGFSEMHRSLSKKAFLEALQQLMPAVQLSNLIPGGAGVRAQAMQPSGAMVDDFYIQQAPRMVHVLNAPSPAATASIAIGQYIARTASASLGLRKSERSSV